MKHIFIACFYFYLVLFLGCNSSSIPVLPDDNTSTKGCGELFLNCNEGIWIFEDELISQKLEIHISKGKMTLYDLSNFECILNWNNPKYALQDLNYYKHTQSAHKIQYETLNPQILEHNYISAYRNTTGCIDLTSGGTELCRFGLNIELLSIGSNIIMKARFGRINKLGSSTDQDSMIKVYEWLVATWPFFNHPNMMFIKKPNIQRWNKDIC